MDIDDEIRYRALTARDPRFDGLFFVGVTSTRIYCRPICTARCPGRDRCRFFSNSALAERDGFRPCLHLLGQARTRALGTRPVDAVRRTARAAACRIEAGALNDGGSLDLLAGDLGYSARQIRRAVKQEFGVSPVELAPRQRLLLAKQPAFRVQTCRSPRSPLPAVSRAFGGSTRLFQSPLPTRRRASMSSAFRTRRCTGDRLR